MKHRLRFIIGVGLIVAAIGYLIVSAVRSTSEYYLTASEVGAREAELMGQTLRIAGRVKPGTIQWDPGSLKLAFVLMPLPPAEQEGVQAAELKAPVMFNVVSTGEPKPDMLAGNRDVIVEGRLGVGNVIEARQVMTKCASKYVPQKTK
jgi:cytochrome c-type biogenesis protein CcmE